MSNPCGTCPFLRVNRQRKHAAGWYTLKNLKRLWNGLRTGDAPGMVCHSTDPESIHYGGDKEIKDGIKRECVGDTTLIQREINILEGYKTLKEYRRDRPYGLTRIGLAHWVNRAVFGGKPIPICSPETDVAIPYEVADGN